MTNIAIQQILYNNIKEDNSKGIYFVDANCDIDFLSYKKLYVQASYLSNALLEQGMKPGDELVFQVQSNKHFVLTFWACIFSKIIPVPITFGVTKEILSKISNLWDTLDQPCLISDFSEWKQKLSQCATIEKEKRQRIGQRVINYSDLTYTKKVNVLESTLDDIFFIQYSSGSTNTPKGVIISQENILHNSNTISEGLNITSEDNFLSWLPLSHDMGLVVFHLIPLLNNASQYLLPPYLFLTYPEIWLKAMSKFETTISGSPNFGYKYVVENLEEMKSQSFDLSNLRFLINSAEPVSIDLCKNFVQVLKPFGLGAQVLRPGYGLSEAVSGVTISADANPLRSFYLNRNKLMVGQPVCFSESDNDQSAAFADLGVAPTTEIKIKDEQDNDLPENTLGIVHLRSRSISSGYYNQPDLTGKVFSEDGWFNTGDLGFVSDGHLVLTGRQKEMILVSGKNYFPNDLDRIIEEIPAIQFQQVATCGIYNADTQKDEIYVFVNFKEDLSNFNTLDQAIRKHLGERAALGVKKVIPVDKIAKTTSGKIQRHILVDNFLRGHYNVYLNQLKTDHPQEEPLAIPVSEEAEALLKIWEEVFEQTVKQSDDFFQLGGDSLKAMKLISKINKRFGVLLQLDDIFHNASFKYQLDRILDNENETAKKIPPAYIADYYPVSDAQRRFFILHLLDSQSVDYNIPVVLKVAGEMDLDRCRAAFSKIIERHEILRTTFELDGVQIIQKVQKEFAFDLEVINRDEGAIENNASQCIQPFELNIPPLFRVFAIKQKERIAYLVLDFHHIIMDLLSYNTLLDEFVKNYHDQDLEELPIQYKDYAVWQKNNKDEVLIDQQREFWMETFETIPSRLNLPVDNYYVDPSLRNQGDTYHFKLLNHLSSKLKQVCQAEKVSMFTVISATFYLLLSKLTKQKDFVVGLSTHGRQHTQLFDLIGVFINTVPIRVKIDPAHNYQQLLQEHKSKMAGYLANQDYSYDLILDDLRKKQLIENDNLFNVMLEYHKFKNQKIESSEFYLEKVSIPNTSSRFDLSLIVAEDENEVRFSLDYSKGLFQKNTIESFANEFEALLQKITEEVGFELKDYFDEIPVNVKHSETVSTQV